MKMRIRKKFAFIFLASLVSFFIVFYIWINNALPTSNKPVRKPHFSAIDSHLNQSNTSFRSATIASRMRENNSLLRNVDKNTGRRGRRAVNTLKWVSRTTASSRS